MSDTPIVDCAAFFADAKLGKTVFVVLHKEAQELERMCNELSNSVRDACHTIAIFGDQPPKMYLDALARWQAMKDQK